MTLKDAKNHTKTIPNKAVQGPVGGKMGNEQQTVISIISMIPVVLFLLGRNKFGSVYSITLLFYFTTLLICPPYPSVDFCTE